MCLLLPIGQNHSSICYILLLILLGLILTPVCWLLLVDLITIYAALWADVQLVDCWLLQQCTSG